MPEGFLLLLDPMEWGQLEVLEYDWREKKTILLIKKILEKNDTFIDIGAHIGTFGLLAKVIVGGEGKVVLVEPQPENQSQILKNIQLNKFTDISLWCCAVGVAQEMISIPIQPETDREKLSLVASHLNTSLTYTTACIPINLIFEKEKTAPPKIVKIDIEGFEYDALKNFDFKRFKPKHFIIEFLPDMKNSSKGSSLIELFRNNDYEVMNVLGQNYSETLDLPDYNIWCRLK